MMISRIRPLYLGCALSGAGAIVLATQAIAAPEPPRIGEFAQVGLESNHPYGPTTSPWVRAVQFPGATYVRVHFSSFDLTPGDWVEVAGPRGERATRYTGRGPLGTGEFWALTIPGDTAMVNLHSEHGGGDGFIVDGAGRGTVPVFGPSGADHSDALFNEPIESGRVCGAPDWQDAPCYQATDPEIYRHARAAVFVIAGCCSGCTAFKVSDTGQFLFSDVCGKQAPPSALEMFLDYESDSCGGSTAHITRSTFGLLAQASDPFDGLDYRLILAVDNAPEIPCLELERHAASDGEPIYIPQHPNAEPKMISVASDRDSGGICQIDPLTSGVRPPQTDVGFMCDTDPFGSFGAPVISAVTHRVLGLSHYGNCPNSAARADKILKKIDTLLDGCSPPSGCTVLSGDRCNCDGICSERERKSSGRTLCGDCPPPE